MPARSVYRKQPRRRVIRALPAERGVVRRTHGRGQPDAPPLVEHRVVHVVPAVPEHFVAVVGRGRGHVGGGRLRRRIPDGKRNLAGGVAHRIEHRNVVGALLQRPVDGTVGVHGRIPAVRAHLVVEVRGAIGPIPQGDHYVAFDTAGSRGRRRGFASLDPVGPVREHLQGPPPAQPVETPQHPGTGLARLNPSLPGRRSRFEVAKGLGDLPRRFVTQLVTGRARSRLEHPKPLSLVADSSRDAVAVFSGARKLRLLRYVQEREPVPGRVVSGRGAVVGGCHGGEIEGGPRGSRLLLRVHQPVTTNPDIVVRVRQVREQVPTRIVRDHDADEPGWEVGGFGDDPDAGLGAVRAGHHATDVVTVDLYGIRGGLARGRTDKGS